jgi:hypothetical protein
MEPVPGRFHNLSSVLFDDPTQQGIMPGRRLAHLNRVIFPERSAIFEICEKEGERTCHDSLLSTAEFEMELTPMGLSSTPPPEESLNRCDFPAGV